jgi:hypothetical protein
MASSRACGIVAFDLAEAESVSRGAKVVGSVRNQCERVMKYRRRDCGKRMRRKCLVKTRKIEVRLGEANFDQVRAQVRWDLEKTAAQLSQPTSLLTV